MARSARARRAFVVCCRTVALPFRVRTCAGVARREVGIAAQVGQFRRVHAHGSGDLVVICLRDKSRRSGPPFNPVDHRVEQLGALCISPTLIELRFSLYRLAVAVDVVAMPSTRFQKQAVEPLLLREATGPPQYRECAYAPDGATGAACGGVCFRNSMRWYSQPIATSTRPRHMNDSAR